MEEIFESVARSKSDMAGVFEFDGETSYFYLWNENATKDVKIVNSIFICNGLPTYDRIDIFIKWNDIEKMVGLYIYDVLWAVFLDSGEAFGGNYLTGGAPDIPESIKAQF